MLTSKLSLSVVAELATALDLATARVPLTLSKSISLASGVGANQADKIFHDTRTLAASATESLDLAGGLTDALGQALTFARVKAIIISAAAANTNNVLLGGDVTNTFLTWTVAEDDAVVIRPGGWFGIAAPDAVGYAVTGATGDLLKLTNSAAGTSVTFDIVIIGASA